MVVNPTFWSGRKELMSVELFPGKHLFVDEHRIETLTAAKRVLNQPQKQSQPVMQAERPWEQKGIHLGKILYDRDRQRFRLWYTAQTDTVLGTLQLLARGQADLGENRELGQSEERFF